MNFADPIQGLSKHWESVKICGRRCNVVAKWAEWRERVFEFYTGRGEPKGLAVVSKLPSDTRRESARWVQGLNGCIGRPRS